MARTISRRKTGTTNMTRNKMIHKLRNYLKTLANKRSSRIVTADDAHVYLTREGVNRNVKTRLSFINSVLRMPTFEPRSSIASSRPAAKGRQITTWSA